MSVVRVWRSSTSGFVKGYGARQLVLDVGGKPTWYGSERCWAFAARRVTDLLALAEHQGRRVEWLGDR